MFICYSRSIGTSKLLPTSLRQKETNSSLNSEHMEIQGITASKNGHLIGGAENQKPSAPFLKRKTDEVWHLVIFFFFCLLYSSF